MAKDINQPEKSLFTPETKPIPVEEPADKLSPHADRPDGLTLLATDETQLTPQQRALLIMERYEVDAEAFFEECREEIEALMKLSPSLAFKALDKLLEKHFSAKISAYISGTLLPQVSEGNPAFTLEKAKRVNNTVFAGVETKSQEYIAWYKIMSAISDVRGQTVQKYLDSEQAQAEMHPSARIEYLQFREITSAVNDFYLAWSRDCALLLSPDERVARGFNDELSTIRINANGEYEETPWTKAFPEQITRIICAYQNTAELLKIMVTEEMPEEDQKIYLAKAKYYEAVAKAYSACDLKIFMKADTLLPGQTATNVNLPIHIHTIERGYAADTIQRIPAASMRYPDADGKQVNELALKTRKDMIRELRKFLAEGDYSEGTWDTLSMVEVTSYIAAHFMEAGIGLDFLPAGQLLPNEVECRIDGGVNVTVNRDGMANRAKRLHDTFEAIFGTEIAEKYFKRGEINLDKISGKSIASHEFGHPIGLTKTTFERHGKNFSSTYPEEWKATVGGMVLAEWRTYKNPEAENQTTIEDLRESLIYRLGCAGRYTSNRQQEHAIPYLRKSLMITKVMADAGVIFHDGKGWNIDLEQSKVEAVYQKLEDQYRKMLELYDKGSREELEEFLSENLQPTQFSREMFAIIDAKFPEDTKGTMTVEEMCALPKST